MRVASKGRIFGFTVDIGDELLAKLKGFPDILQKANEDGARYWHGEILPKHFEPSAHAKYGYAQRAKNYLKQTYKRGLPDLVFTRSMQTEMTTRIGELKATARGAAVKLRAKTLNFCPNMGENNQDLYVTHAARNGHRRSYPNLKREIKVVLDEERQAVADAVKKSATQQMQRKGAA